MAFVPISGIVPQATENGNQANGMVLKFYEPGTLTPLAVGIDSTGVTQTTEFLLNIEGYTTLSGNKEIPHVDQIYKIVLYLNQSDADANDTGSAVYVIDDIDVGDFTATPIPTDVDYDSLADAVTSTIGEIGDFISTSEYNLGSGVGGAKYKIVAGGTGTTDGGSFIDKTDGSGFQLMAIWENDQAQAYQFGCLLDGVTVDLDRLQAYAAYLSTRVNGTNLDTTNWPIFYIPPSDGAVIDAKLNIPFGISVIMDAPILVKAAAGATEADGWVRIGSPPNSTTRGRNLEYVLDVRRITLSDWVSEDDLGCWLDTVQAARVWIRRFDNFTIGCRIGGAYSEIRLGEFRDNQIGMWYTNQANSFSTTTQFYGGEFAVISASNPGKNRYGVRISQSKVESMNSVVMNGQSYELSQAGAGAAEAIPMLVEDFISLNAENQRSEGNDPEVFARLTGDCRWCTFNILNLLALGAGLNTKIDDQSTFKIGNVLSEHSTFNFANSYKIFDSGRLADKTIAYDATNENIAGMEGILNTGAVQPATFNRFVSVSSINTDGSITLGSGVNNNAGVKINTRNCKKFAMVLDQDQANATTCNIVVFDSAGNQLTADTDVLTNQNTPTVTPNLGVAGGLYVLSGIFDPPKNQSVITFSANVATAYFAISNGIFFGLKIFALETSAETFIDDSDVVPDNANIVSQAPVVGTHKTGRFAYLEAPAAGATKVVNTAGGTPGTWITE